MIHLFERVLVLSKSFAVLSYNRYVVFVAVVVVVNRHSTVRAASKAAEDAMSARSTLDQRHVRLDECDEALYFAIP